MTKFHTFEGALWQNDHVVREIYDYAFQNINSGVKLRSALRHERFAWPGGYPLFFLVRGGGALSFDAVRENLVEVIWALRHPGADLDWEVVAVEINFEDPDLYCDHSGERIESAYAEDEF